MPGRDKDLIFKNGLPIPQSYNPQTGQWESYIGVSWGKTAGGLYVPIRVDDQGRQEVTLSGTIPSREEIIFAREIRSTTPPWTTVPVPAGAKGVKLYTTIWGVTGTFGEDEGLALYCLDINPSGGHFPTVVSRITKRVNAGHSENTNDFVGHRIQPALYIYPGLNESVNLDSNVVELWGIPLGSRIRVVLDISGTFAPGEGFDCSLVALWLF